MWKPRQADKRTDTQKAGKIGQYHRENKQKEKQGQVGQ